MSKYSTIPDWMDMMEDLLLKDKSTALGVFDPEGRLLDANQAMCYFLDTGLSEKNPLNGFINPEFSTIAARVHEGKVFEGLLTIGNHQDISYTLKASIFRKGEKIMVYAETDVPQLFRENKMMSLLNQQVNNLQRQLIKEKLNLQETLKVLKETQQMLIHSEKMNAMGKLVAGVAHEINNPISFVYSNLFSFEKYLSDFIRSYTELEQLIKNNANQELISLANEIRTTNDIDFLVGDMSDMARQSKIGIDRVKTIVEDLRKFSRLDEADLKLVDLKSNLEATVAIAAPELKTRNISFKLITPEKLLLECYPGQLNQALLNVIINAAQAIVMDGNVTIEVVRSNDIVKISIKDDGCGIPENIREKIFDPFFTTKPVGSGTGLGLSITYKIITELHKGTIHVESAEGCGTSVTILIPLKQLDQ